jgi:hypothetical protein
MRKSLLAVAVMALVGVQIPTSPAQATSYRQTQVSRTSHSQVRVSQTRRSVQRPVRQTRWSAPPRGSYLVRGRYWDTRIRWKTDPQTRSLFAMYRGEVWFLDPTSGWAYTVDRYGRVYTADPRYRAVYYVDNISTWDGDLPYFFGYFSPYGGYYSLPRYRYYASYWDSPRYSWYGYYDAYDFWWDSYYPRYFRGNTFVTVVNFNYYDVRYISYDRHYRRDVYVDYRGNSYIAPQPATINGVPTGAAPSFARAADLSLPVASENVAISAPPPSQATALVESMPEMPVVDAAPALPVAMAETIADNTKFDTPMPSMPELETVMEAQPLPQTQEPVTTAFGESVALEQVMQPSSVPSETSDQTTAREDVFESRGDQVPAQVGGAEFGQDQVQSIDPTVNGSDASQPSYSEPQYSEPSAATPSYQEPQYQEPQASEPSYSEPQYQEPQQQYSEPSYSEPQYQEPQASEPSYSEPQYQEPQQQYSEPSYSEPSYSEPQYQEPQQQYSEPSYSEPSYSEPQYEQPQQQYEEPQYEQPQYEEPRYEEPQQQYEEPRYEQPQYEEPRYEEPQQQYEEPRYEQPQYEEPRYEAPQQQYEEPRYEAPSYEAPSYSAPEPSYEAPSYSAPEPSYSEPAPNYSSDEENPN